MKKKTIPSYEKQISSLFRQARTNRSFLSLDEGLRHLFPATRPREFKVWKEKIGKASIETELLLFMALICGAQFRMSRPDPNKALGDLWTWLTQGLHNKMDPDLAELVIEALAPGIMKAIDQRGYRRGPDGPLIKKKGRPPETRGAWVAAFAAEEYLRQMGMKSTRAKEIAIEFIAILLGRKEDKGDEKGKKLELSEFYRTRKKAPESIVKELTNELIREYKFLLEQDTIGSIDIKPPENEIEKFAEWNLRHKSLHSYFIRMGYEGVCSLVLSRMPRYLWEPFWTL